MTAFFAFTLTVTTPILRFFFFNFSVTVTFAFPALTAVTFPFFVTLIFALEALNKYFALLFLITIFRDLPSVIVNVFFATFAFFAADTFTGPTIEVNVIAVTTA